MEIWQAIILGIVEGLTEFFPISSTGHMILTAKVMKLAQSEFVKSFEIAIQLGAILAVVVIYWRSLFFNFAIAKRIAAAFFPTAILGVIFYKAVKACLLSNYIVVLWALFLGGLFLIIFEMRYKENQAAGGSLEKISFKAAILIGVFQALAMIPGVSRSAATIIGGLCLGLKRKTIVEFSFLLAVPTMLAATGLDLIKSGASFTFLQYQILGIGFLTSFFVAFLSVKLFLFYVQRNNFIPFGIYRVVLAIFFFFWLARPV